MRGRGAGVLVLLAGLVALVFPASGLAASAWRLGHSPAAIANGATATISLTIANQGGPDGNDDLGCVTIDIPSVFDVRSSTVTAAPPGTIWTASASGSTTVRVRASNGGDRLDADASNQSVSVDIGVRGTIAGRYTWVADAWVSQDCSDGFDDPIAFQITINAKVVATPVPTPPPTPTPAPTPTPVPTPNVTPVPTALPPTPTPTPTATLAPGPTATAQPTPTPPPGAGGSVTPPSPSSGAGSSTRPSAEPTPAPALAGAAGNGTAGPDSSPPGAGLLMPGMDPSTGHSSVDGPAIDLTGAMLTPFDEMFEWAVPTLVLSVPGLLVVAAVLVQMLGALAWLPLVRRRLGGFGLLGERPNPIGPGRSTRR